MLLGCHIFPSSIKISPYNQPMWLGQEWYFSLVRSCKCHHASCSIVHSAQNLLNILCKCAGSFIRRPFKSPVGAGFMCYWTWSSPGFLPVSACRVAARLGAEVKVWCGCTEHVHGAMARDSAQSAGLGGSVHAD